MIAQVQHSALVWTTFADAILDRCSAARRQSEWILAAVMKAGLLGVLERQVWARL
jgi:hypothetical protein